MTLLEKARIVPQCLSLPHKRGRDSVVYAPFTSIQSHRDSVHREPKFFSPITQGARLSFVSQEARRATIKCLLASRSPTTILSAVMSVVIDPFNSRILPTKLSTMARERLEHVIDKFLERFPLTLNSSPTIPRKSGIIRIMADGLHATPTSA